jgi:hypothetical protein
VQYVRRIADVRRLAHPGTTLLVVGDTALSDDQVTAIGRTGADLALVDATWALDRLMPGAQTSTSTGFAPTTRSAACDDPDAVAAGTITVGGGIAVRGSSVTGCFPSPDSPRDYAYVVADGARRIAALSEATPLENAHLADEGNAALVLRMLGRHRDLVWYVPSFNDQGTGSGSDSSGPSLRDLVPRQVSLLALAALLVLVLAALWRGRRLGRLVTEPLPVVVPGGETTRGRGRLYRRARAHGHAAAALRAGTATRCATRLGLPRTAERPALVAAIANATGRDPRLVDDLLYGPPPTDDRALTRLARDLDALESEVDRP